MDHMKTILPIIVSIAGIGSTLFAGDSVTRNLLPSLPTIDDPIHTPAELVRSMHRAFGNDQGRAIYAKGIILEGVFTPDARAKELTKASHLQGPASKVTVRFSNFGGLVTFPDNAPMADPRGMGIRFELPGGKSTDLIAHSYNGFPVSRTDDFRELMLSIAASDPSAAPRIAL